MLSRHGEEFRCSKCGGEVDAVAHSDSGESRFAFAITHRSKDGSAIDPPFLATLEATKCRLCGNNDCFIDSLVDNEDEQRLWTTLPKWEKVH